MHIIFSATFRVHGNPWETRLAVSTSLPEPGIGVDAMIGPITSHTQCSKVADIHMYMHHFYATAYNGTFVLLNKHKEAVQGQKMSKTMAKKYCHE